MFHVKHSFDITGFQLKLVAIVAMTCNHVANVFGAHLPEALNFVLYAVGGMTFPIMAFLLVEGYRHTSDLRRYALRLFVFALVAQVPFSLVFGLTANVLFTLLAGLGILWLNDRFGVGLGLLVTVGATLLAGPYLDWGSIGLVMIYLFGTLREEGKADTAVIVGTMALPLCIMCFAAWRTGDMLMLGYALVGFTIATVLLCGYQGRRGRSMKWFFYAYYPLHLFAIWLVTVIMP